MRTLLLLITLTLLSALPAFATDVLILQSGRNAAYTEALRGFHATSNASYRTLVMSDYAEVDVERLVKEDRPRLVVAIGDRALTAARKVREVPVVTLLSLSLNLQKQWADNIGGVSMAAAPAQYLKLLASMGLKSFGVLYDPAKTGRYLKRIAHDAKQLGLTLVAEPVSSSREIQAKLEKFSGNVDALWILPDSTVATTVNMEAFLVYSMTHNLPVVTFSSQHLNSGAAASLDIDYFDVGQQAGEMTVSVLNSESRKVPTADPRKTRLRTNDKVIHKLGIQLSGLGHEN